MIMTIRKKLVMKAERIKRGSNTIDFSPFADGNMIRILSKTRDETIDENINYYISRSTLPNKKTEEEEHDSHKK